jgi:hypothetical protein
MSERHAIFRFVYIVDEAHARTELRGRDGSANGWHGATSNPG